MPLNHMQSFRMWKFEPQGMSSTTMFSFVVANLENNDVSITDMDESDIHVGSEGFVLRGPRALTHIEALLTIVPSMYGSLHYSYV